MNLPRRQFLHLAAGAAALPVLSQTTTAQTYPTRPITIVVPYAAGGTTDVIARVHGDRMRTALGQPVLVENVVGAGGSIGLRRVARASPDGYTVVIGKRIENSRVGRMHYLLGRLRRPWRLESMNIRIVTGLALSSAIAFGVLCDMGRHVAWAASAAPAEACTQAMNNATIDEASKLGTQTPEGPDAKLPAVSLGDTIAVRISGLAELRSACAGMPIVLYLNNYLIKSLKPFPPTPPPIPAAGGGAAPNSPPNSGELYFVLDVTDASRDSWKPILRAPCCSERDLKVSVGIEDQYPLRPSAGKTLPEIRLNIIGNKWFGIWAAIFVAMVIGVVRSQDERYSRW